MKDKNVECEIKDKMANEHVCNVSLIKCIIYFKRN